MGTLAGLVDPCELVAPAAWRTVDFISDLHLHAADPATFAAWQHYLQTTPADAVFILGDLFEVWVGDDSVDADLVNADFVNADLRGADSSQASPNFETRCAQVLRAAASRTALYFMHGNRDFLVGRPLAGDAAVMPNLMAQCHMTLLSDPTVLIFDNDRWLLSHGDALCLADTAYLQFRAQVRSPAWQRDFLARPLAVRQAIARDLRWQSQAQHAARQQAALPFADVDTAAACAWLAQTGSHTLIHGHTHRPAVHDLGGGRQRLVLSDWDAAGEEGAGGAGGAGGAAGKPRADALRLSAGHPPTRINLLENPGTATPAC